MGSLEALEQNREETQWQKGQSGNPAGRPPDKIKKFLKSCNVTKADIDAIYDNLLCDYTIPELKAMLQNGIGKKDKEGRFIDIDGNRMPEYLEKFANEMGEFSALISVIISGIIRDVNKGDMRVTNSLLDRRHGKAKESVEHSGGLQLFKVTQEDIDALET